MEERIHRLINRFYEIDDHYKVLMDENPREAIESVRRLKSDELIDNINIDMIKAGTLIDAGAIISDLSAINEGIEILNRLKSVLPNRDELSYNLANGIIARANLLQFAYPDWFLATLDDRRQARLLFRRAAISKTIHRETASLSFTNLANSLRRSGRQVEAYDAYINALNIDPTNGIALTGAARVLLWYERRNIGDPKILRGLAAKYLKVAREYPDRITDLAGKKAFESLSKLLEHEIPIGTVPDVSKGSPYQQFIAKHRLALSPTIEGLDLSISLWDSLHILSVTEPIDVADGAPPLFAMFNMLKSDYLAARYLAFQALENQIIESGKYVDTLDYANYGIDVSLLELAQRASLDLLDKVAIATTEYLKLPGKASSIYFSNRWFKDRSPSKLQAWQTEINAEIHRGNLPLYAITEVSRDVEEGGYLREKKIYRHSSTHRFTVLHDLGGHPIRDSKFIDHYPLATFTEQVIETLQLSRAILFSFTEMISFHEQSMNQDGKAMPLFLPDHDWIRGES